MNRKEVAAYFERSLACSMPNMRFEYTNYKGNTAVREVEGLPHVWYGCTEYHKEPQWLMTAYDVEKQALRDFAMSDIKAFLK